MDRNRIVFLDGLRGFALFGILYTHFVIWYTGSALPASVYQAHGDTPSMVAMAIFGTLFLGKFFSIFSFLFGVSFHIQKNAALPGNVSAMHALTMRFVMLIMFGFVHHLFWRGDILMIYGLLGFGLLAMNHLSSRVLIFWTVFFLLNIPGLLVRITTETGSLPMAEDAARHLLLMQRGSVSDFLRDNMLIFDNKLAFQLESGRLSRTFGFFLLGLYASRKRLFTSEAGSQQITTVFRITGRLLFVMVSTAAILFLTGHIWFDHSETMFKSVLPLSAPYNLYNVLLSVFLITGMYRLFTSSRLSGYLKVFTWPGRMAMSVYVMQTVIGLALFYPFGLNLFAVTSPAVNAVLVIPVFLFQLGFCRWWLLRFKQGPLEWAMRSVVRGEYGSPAPRRYSQPAPEAVRNNRS